jgi:Fungal specific transcription factor domain/Fungal Zn(2)-Cys(6) binuclear cluster domain
MDSDRRFQTSKDDVDKNISLSGRDHHSNSIPSYTQQSSTLSNSLSEHGLRHSRAPTDYFSHISPGSSSDQLHGSTPNSTGNAMAYDAALGGYLNEMSMGMSNDGRDPNDPLADLKRPRACEACRQLKVRCELDNDSSGSCKRCAKAKRKCVVTVPTRKRQKKTDSRVSDLEKKIDALTASLQVPKRTGTSPPRHDGAQDQGAAPRRWRGGEQPAASASPTAGTKRTFSGDTKIPRPSNQVSQSSSFIGPATSSSISTMPSTWQSAAANPPHSNSNPNEIIDVIDRGLIDFQTATDIFKHYVEKVAPTLPILIFPAGTTMTEVRHNKPILFHAIMTLSIAIVRPDLQMSLVQEVHRIFADRVVVKGEKSLELVQSIMLACIWYTPPDQFEELKFFQFIHLAIVMAMDIGMGRVTKRRGSNQNGLLREIMGKNPNRAFDPDAPETRRIWLGAYFMAVNASMALRRPLLCRWHAYMDECIEILRHSSEPSDKILIHWAKLSHIAEEIGFQFSMDDPTSNLSMSDTKVRYALKGFEKQLDEWRQEIAPEHYTRESLIDIIMCNVTDRIYI